MSLRILCLLSLTLSACGTFGISSEQRAQLVQHQEQAKRYYDGNRLPQALDQVRQGLEIDAKDYQLNYMRGYCLLRQANDPRYATTPARRRALLEEAATAFDTTLALRSESDHDPRTLLGVALLHEEMARFKLEQQKQVQEENGATDLDANERALQEVRVRELIVQRDEHLLIAERTLKLLIERGDLLLLAHKHMLNVSSLRGLEHYATSVQHGQAFLERSQAQQDAKRKQIEQTTDFATEQEAQARLNDLVAEEVLVRAQLANLHFDKGNFAQTVAELDRILTLDPTRAPDYYNRARALHKLGRNAEAYKDVQKFLATHSLPPGHASLARAHALLRELEQHQ